MNAFVDAKRRDVRLKYLTEITTENISVSVAVF
jgi:hypothetical protein